MAFSLLICYNSIGKVAERSIVAVSKTVVRVTVPWVRIPSFPPLLLDIFLCGTSGRWHLCQFDYGIDFIHNFDCMSESGEDFLVVEDVICSENAIFSIL